VKRNGRACAASAECASGYCVDGQCCDGACTGQCEACDIAGLEGKCSGVSGPPHALRAACSDGAGDVCKALACDGTKDRTKCSTYANGLDKECVAATCSNGTATSSATCDGAGHCTAPTTTSCNAYACDATSCKTSCATDTDCAASYVCSVGKCVPQIVATCSADGTQSTPVGDGGTTQSCTPYKCTSAGTCGTSCVTSGDCLSGFACETSSQHCVADGSGSNASGSCAITQRPGRRDDANTSLGALLVAVIAVGASRRARIAVRPEARRSPSAPRDSRRRIVQDSL
jgi:hypothetical protein